VRRCPASSGLACDAMIVPGGHRPGRMTVVDKISLLRTTLLPRPYNTPSLPLDIGFANSVPVSIRRDPSGQRDRKKCARNRSAG
jgi:hypothetical protein